MIDADSAKLGVRMHRYCSRPNHLLTPWNKVLLEKLTGSQLVKKFSALYGMWRFITAFTLARHLSLSWTSSIQSTPPHPTSCRSILMLFSYLRLVLPSGLFPSGFPTKTLYIQITTTLNAWIVQSLNINSSQGMLVLHSHI